MFTDLQVLLEDLSSPLVAVEVALLVLCIALAYLFSRFLGAGQPKDSIWFGRKTVDGLLFPLISLGLVYAASRAMAQYRHVALLKVAVPVFLSLVAIRLAVRVLTVTFPRSGVARLIERAVSSLAWIAALLWIVGLLPAVMNELDSITLSFGRSHVSLRTVIDATLSCGLVVVVTLWISAALEKRLLSGVVEDLSMRRVVANATRAVLLLLGLLLALSAVGVDLTALSVLGGALGVGIGFGLQRLASNYVSGFVILLERSLRIGDFVKVDGFEGRISDIKTRYTIVRALNGRESVVPNEVLITQRVENLSLQDPQYLLSCNLTVGYDSDVAQVQALLCAAAASCSRVLADPAPAAHLANLGADGLEFSLLFWIVDPHNGQLNVRSEVNIAALHALRGAGVEIPYPQRVVHLRGAVPGS